MGSASAALSPQPKPCDWPPFKTFRNAESHAATLAHELTHWTKHDERLARDMGGVK
jgi:antirestriction protein ArdC